MDDLEKSCYNPRMECTPPPLDQLWVALKNSAKWLGQGPDLKRPVLLSGEASFRAGLQVHGVVPSFAPKFKNEPLRLLRRWPITRTDSGQSLELLYGRYFDELGTGVLLKGRLERPCEQPIIGARIDSAYFNGEYLGGFGRESFETLFEQALWDCAYAVLGQAPSPKL
jgi:hypothetical protein